MAATTTLCELLDTLACRLNDGEEGYEFTRWSHKFLVAAINSALKVLRAERPDLFITLVPYILTPNCVQQPVPTDCEFHSFAYTDLGCDEGGGPGDNTGLCVSSTATTAVTPVEFNAVQARISAALQARSCATFNKANGLGGDTEDVPFQVTAWEFSSKTGGNYFTVSPTPPADEEVNVFLNCIMQAPCFSVPNSCPEPDNDTQLLFDEDVNIRLCHYLPFIEEYALYVALARDDTSNLQDSKAQAHLNTAMAMLGRTKVADYMQHRDNMHLIGPITEERDNFTVIPRGGI